MTAALTAEERILEMIRKGELPAGRHIAHRPLAKALGMSNIPVTQALHKLVGQGILTRDAAGVTRVRTFSRREMQVALALREMIEGLAARFCAEAATDEELVVLEVKFDRLAAVQSHTAYAPDEDMAFHETIVAFAHAPLLAHQYAAMTALRSTFTLRAGSLSAEEILTMHRRIFEAIRQRNGGLAEALAREHVAGVQERFSARVGMQNGV